MTTVDESIARIEEIAGYTFINNLLCAEALTTDGALYTYVDGAPHLVEKNKNLEAVGDAIIDAVLVKIWYEFRNSQGHRLAVGQFDAEIRQRNACNNFFTSIGRGVGIDACILMNAGMSEASDRMVANTVEAIIGAAYIDAGADGLDAVRSIMTRLGLDNPPLFST